MEKTGKISTVILWVLMVVSVVLFFIMIPSIDDEKNPGAQAIQMITLNMNWAIIMVATTTLIVLFFAIAQIFTDKAQVINALIVLLIFGAILGISYALASSEIPTFYGVEKFVADGTLTTTVSKWVGTSLYAAYILFGIAFLSIAGFGVSGMFKKS